MAIRWPHSESFQTKRFETNPTVEYWKCDHEWFPRKGNDYVVACSKCKETRVIDEPVKGHRKYGTFECICISGPYSMCWQQFALRTKTLVAAQLPVAIALFFRLLLYEQAVRTDAFFTAKTAPNHSHLNTQLESTFSFS
eukprot:g28090.t1